jgi:hypothetical protein
LSEENFKLVENYRKEVNALQLSGKNLKDIQQLEKGLKIEEFEIKLWPNGISLPVYFTSFLDNE